MNRVRQRCLFVSVMIHVSLGLLLIFSPGFSSRDEEVPVLELVPSVIHLTDDGQVSGGNPNAVPAPPNAKPAGAPAPVPPAVSEPIQRNPPPVAEPPKAPEARELAHHTPVSEPDSPAPNKKVEPAELSSHEPVPDPSRDKPPDTSKSNDSPNHRRHKIEINPEIKRRSPDDAAAERQAQEKADAENRRRAQNEAINRYNQQRQQLANNLGSTASSLARGTSGAMDIQMPGAGGEVFADYRSYLAAFYKQKWNQHKPGGISVKTASALTIVTIGRDGKVRSYKVVESSGLAEVDRTIRLVFDRYNQLQPFPSSSKDDERTFTLTFRIESESSP